MDTSRRQVRLHHLHRPRKGMEEEGDHPIEEVDHLMVAVQPRPETGDWESDITLNWCWIRSNGNI